MKKIALLLIAFATVFTACDDDVAATIDTKAPTITARLFFENSNCNPCEGETLNIHFEITENDELHNIEAFLQQSFLDAAQDYNNAEFEKLYNLNGHSHSQSYLVDTSIVVDTIHESTFYLIVNASDHNGNESSDTATIYVQD